MSRCRTILKVIDEVVVTALGIKREKKMLGYAVQEIKSDQLNKTGDPSVTSALQGKVAGLQDEYGRYRFGRFHQDYDSW